MAHLSPRDFDRLERAVMDGQRVALVRQGREIIVVPLRLYVREGREVIEARHPTTGDLITSAIEDLDKAELAKRIAEMEAAIAKLAEGSELDKEITRLDHFRTVLQNLEGTALH